MPRALLPYRLGGLVLKLAEADDEQKTEPTFSDAMAEVRRLFWEKTLFAQPYFRQAVQKVPPKLKQFLMDCLCQAI